MSDNFWLDFDEPTDPAVELPPVDIDRILGIYKRAEYWSPVIQCKRVLDLPKGAGK